MASEEFEEEIKRGRGKWRWSEMQSLEVVSENPNLPLGSPEPNMEMEGENSKNAEKDKEISVGFKELFRFADRLDYVLMGIGSVGAFVHGCSLPIFLRFFADLVNSFGSNANNIDKMSHEVLRVTIFFKLLIIFHYKYHIFLFSFQILDLFS